MGAGSEGDDAQPRVDATFPRSARVRKRFEHRAAQERGRRVQTPHFVLIVLARDGQGPSRLGITVTKKIGTAVARNRTKRVLREAIGRVYGLDPNRIICGAGSDEILNLLAHTYLKQGDEAISTAHGFLVYPIATMANGAKNVVAPETEYTANVDAILARVTPRTKLVWLANPNNPTGTYIPFDEVKRLRAGLPGHVLLVLDAAYSDYVSRNDYELGIELVATTENTVVTHTFSKIHGLAALRIGWMFGSANIVDAVNRIRGPFNVSTAAMNAAVAAIEDTAHVQTSKAHTERWRNWLTEEISRLGLKVTPSVANFVLIHFPSIQGKTSAEADVYLTKRGLVLRALNNYGLPHALRMTIGTEEANRLVVEALRDFMAGK